MASGFALQAEATTGRAREPAWPVRVHCPYDAAVADRDPERPKTRPRKGPDHRLAVNFAHFWATGGAALAAISTGLPWFATNIAPPFSKGTTSGLQSGIGAKIVLALMLVALFAGLCLMAASRELLRISLRAGVLLTALMLIAASAAAVIVASRLIVLPSPAGFASRQYGIYLAALGCGTTVVVCGRQLLGR